MFVPTKFKEDNPERLQQHIREVGFGLLVVAGEQGIEANHAPFHLITGEQGHVGHLQCHVARVNPIWQHLEQGAEVLVVFQGPHAYVSPSWYPTKAETGRAVPTWNYLAVHARGRARVVQDIDWLRKHLNQLTDQHEAGRVAPWSVSDAPADYTERLMQAIVGIDIEIDSLTGQLKASQNQPERNRAGVKAGLEQDDHNPAMARYIV